VITCRALHRDPASNGQPPPSHRTEVVKIQSPDLERIHPAMTCSEWDGSVPARYSATGGRPPAVCFSREQTCPVPMAGGFLCTVSRCLTDEPGRTIRIMALIAAPHQTTGLIFALSSIFTNGARVVAAAGSIPPASFVTYLTSETPRPGHAAGSFHAHPVVTSG